MTDALADWWVHDVTVERLTGEGAYGPTYASAQTVTGFVDDERKLVRSVGGEEIVATASVFLPAATTDIPLDSRVTLPALFGSRECTVIAVARHDAGGQPTPNHLEVYLR